MYHLESSQTAMVGPAKATDLIKLNTFSGQRPMSRSVVLKYADMMKNGVFVKGAVATGSANGHQVLVNGQHQLQAVIESGVSVKFTIDQYNCDAESDMWKLYATFDVGRQRTEMHMVMAARDLFKTAALREMPCRFLAVCGAALWTISARPLRILHTAPTKTTKVELIEKHASEIVWLEQMLRELSDTGNHIHEMTVPMAASIFLTYRANEMKASEFWTPIITSAGLVARSPQWKLHQIIREKYGHARSYIFNYIASAVLWWNSWITGDGRKIVQVSSLKEIPECETGD